LHGTIRFEGGRTRVTIEISDAAGYVAWSDRLEAANEEPLQLQDTLAAEIVSRVPAHAVDLMPHSREPRLDHPQLQSRVEERALEAMAGDRG
jgi:hypothetical protein